MWLWLVLAGEAFEYMRALAATLLTYYQRGIAREGGALCNTGGCVLREIGRGRIELSFRTIAAIIFSEPESAWW